MSSKKEAQPLAVERLRERLSYDPETGEFRWRTILPAQRQKVGDLAGHLCPSYEGGARFILTIDGVEYYAHRVAFFYVHGRWPTQLIDHINNDPSDNRIANLRESTPQQNTRNARRWASHTTGLKGVNLRVDSGKYRARIRVDGKLINLGQFDTAEAAHAAYCAAADRYFGEFARAG